jgi:hypothetical protein
MAFPQGEGVKLEISVLYRGNYEKYIVDSGLLDTNALGEFGAVRHVSRLGRI